MTSEQVVSAVIPALDEEDTIHHVVTAIAPHVSHVIVADNGSTDKTRDRAGKAGAIVVHEPQRGYGAACLTGIAKARELGTDVLLLLDADGSDDPTEAPLLLAGIHEGHADLVLGIRTPASTEPGAMTPQQRFGNWLAPWLMRRLLGAPFLDMPPFKAITMDALESLELLDRGYGFTIELLIRAHQRGLRVKEVVVCCRNRRGGESKVSGTFAGSAKAAGKILWTITRHALRHAEPQLR